MSINRTIIDWIDGQPEHTRDWIYSMLSLLIDSRASAGADSAAEHNEVARRLIDPDDRFKFGAAVVAVGVIDHILHPEHRFVTSAGLLRMADDAEADGQKAIAADLRQKAPAQDMRNEETYQAVQQWQAMRATVLSYEALSEP